jgi:hypothetical protein
MARMLRLNATNQTQPPFPPNRLRARRPPYRHRFTALPQGGGFNFTGKVIGQGAETLKRITGESGAYVSVWNGGGYLHSRRAPPRAGYWGARRGATASGPLLHRAGLEEAATAGARRVARRRRRRRPELTARPNLCEAWGPRPHAPTYAHANRAQAARPPGPQPARRDRRRQPGACAAAAHDTHAPLDAHAHAHGSRRQRMRGRRRAPRVRCGRE